VRAAVAAALTLCTAGALRAQGPADEINTLLDSWHHAAAVADETAYFGALDSTAVYLGTDPGERWSKEEFHEWAKPQFAKGSAWAFVPFGRHVTLGPDGVAWFDEKLKWFDTRLNVWMTGLRGSGVLRRTPAGWRIEQYNLTMELPNDRLSDIVHLIRVTPPVAPADARGIIATVRAFLTARAGGDSAGLREALDPGGRVVLAPGDSDAGAAGAWRAAGGRDSTPEITLLSDGTVATLWAPFTTRVAGRLAVCGLEEFQLIRTPGTATWRITSLAVHPRTTCGNGGTP